ncbi:MAG: alcohol dehydrogenase catalytic domain-containing protein, partial [Chloroflexi bacterium]|nr:alcohol dehydrogenase catalytic domain-containing protein [Chloroflexota bacterium]
MSAVRALELTGFDGASSLHVAERPTPEPGPGEVRVRFRAMALNHLDVFVTHGLPKRPLPAVLGSDGAGIVDAVGPDVTSTSSGAEVVLYPIESDGTCAACRAGQEVHCPHMAILGEHTEGTLQEQLVVPAGLCEPRPRHLSWEESAALPLAWLTAWRLLFTRGRLRSGDTVVLVGIGGGVATACLLLGKAHGLRVIVTSREEAKRQRALDLGADLALPSEGFSKAVQAATDGLGARAVVDTVGPATLDESIRSLAREGEILTVGATSGPKVELLLPRLWFRHLSLITST